MKYANIEVVAHGTEENLEKIYEVLKDRFQYADFGMDGLSVAFGSYMDEFETSTKFCHELIDYSVKYGLRIMYRAYEEYYVPEEETDLNYTAFETEEFWVEKGEVIKMNVHDYNSEEAEEFFEEYEDFYEWTTDMPNHDELPEIA